MRAREGAPIIAIAGDQSTNEHLGSFQSLEELNPYKFFDTLPLSIRARSSIPSSRYVFIPQFNRGPRERSPRSYLCLATSRPWMWEDESTQDNHFTARPRTCARAECD